MTLPHQHPTPHLHTATEADLQRLLEGFGRVNYTNINRSTGIGFATMADEEQARAALEQLHDTEFQGRHIFVDYAAKAFLPPSATRGPDGRDRDRERRDARRGDRSRSRG